MQALFERRSPVLIQLGRLRHTIAWGFNFSSRCRVSVTFEIGKGPNCSDLWIDHRRTSILRICVRWAQQTLIRKLTSFLRKSVDWRSLLALRTGFYWQLNLLAWSLRRHIRGRLNCMCLQISCGLLILSAYRCWQNHDLCPIHFYFLFDWSLSVFLIRVLTVQPTTLVIKSMVRFDRLTVLWI